MKLNPFPNDTFQTLPNWKNLQTSILNLMKMEESSSNGKKTLWEKEKLLVRSNFSFSRCIFKRHVPWLVWEMDKWIFSQLLLSIHLRKLANREFKPATSLVFKACVLSTEQQWRDKMMSYRYQEKDTALVRSSCTTPVGSSRYHLPC